MKIKLDIVRLSDYASRLQKVIQKSEFPEAIWFLLPNHLLRLKLS